MNLCVFTRFSKRDIVSTYEEVDDEHGDGDDDGGVESNNDRGQRPLRPLLRLTFAF